MNEELEKFDLETIDKTFTHFKVGAKVQAKVVAEATTGFIVNIGGKKDGFIPKNEEEYKALAEVKVGDEFETIIVNTKDESGMIVLSKQKADYLRWGNEVVNGLKVGDATKVIITNFNKSGLISTIGNFEVFIPYSQISSRRVDELKNYVNKQLDVVILEINLSTFKIVASSRAFEENERHTVETAFWEAIFENKVVSGKVVRFTDFGAFVNVDGVDCLVHNSEIAYDKNTDPKTVLEMDKTYSFKVIKLDRENKKVSLSYKRLQPNPLTEKIKKLSIGDVVNGQVVKILPFGAVIKFNDEIEGILHVKEASHFYVKNVYEVAKVGQKLDLKIIEIDIEKNRVSLSLKAMQEVPEVVKLVEDSDKE